MRNDAETFHEANSHYVKYKQKQNDNFIEFERDRRVRSRVEREIDSKFTQKTHFKLNHCVN
jgi:hypothetical protein